MTKAVFIVSRQPYGAREDGDTILTRLLIDAMTKVCSVSVVALSDEPAVGARPVEVAEIPKPSLHWGRLAAASVVQRRSLIHSRFAPRSLRMALADVSADVFLARRVYMAQAVIDAGRVPPDDRLVVLVDVLESMVMSLRRSPLRPLLELEARRTRRDEVRCVRAASQLAYFSETESRELGRLLQGRPRLDLVLPAAPRSAALDDPVAVFVGDRTWGPNADALSKLLGLWSRISRIVPQARLLVVGRPGAREPVPRVPNVERLGFVDDLEAVWRKAAVLLAPVSTGGGVRVKVLDAARHGVPVVGTRAAIGSTDRYLPLDPGTTDEGFTADAVELLSDRLERRRRGAELYEVNRALNARGFVENQVAELLAGSVGVSDTGHPSSLRGSAQR